MKWMKMRLSRIADTPHGMFGVLSDGGIPFCLTMERPWLDNRRNISCIPAGSYVCKRAKSPKFGDTFEVCDVPGRSEILFHKGNLMADTHGCIVMGEMFEPLNGIPAVLSSGKAMDEFLKITSTVNEFDLEVVDSACWRAK